MFGREIAFTARLNLWGRVYAFFWGFPLIGPRIRDFHIIKILKTIRAPTNILDAGCGIGNYCFYLAKRFAKARITGIDCDQKAIQDANLIRKRLNANNVHFIVQDLLKIKPKKTYDLVMLIDVLEHIEDDEKTLKNLFNALKTGGDILVHVPRCNDRHSSGKDTGNLQPGHVREGYMQERLKKMLQKTGFKIMYTRNTFGFFGSLSYELEKRIHKKSKLLLKIIFPLLLCLARLDTFMENTDGNGLLVRATK